MISGFRSANFIYIPPVIPAGIVRCASSSFCGMGHLSAVCFLQGSWSSFQLQRENFWLGRDGLGLRKNWIIQEYEAFEKKISIRVQEIGFFYRMPSAHD